MLDLLLNFCDELLVCWTVKYLSIVFFVLEGIDWHRLRLVRVDSLEVYPVPKGLAEVHIVVGQKCHAFPFGKKYFVEITFLGG